MDPSSTASEPISPVINEGVSPRTTFRRSDTIDPPNPNDPRVTDIPNASHKQAVSANADNQRDTAAPPPSSPSKPQSRPPPRTWHSSMKGFADPSYHGRMPSTDPSIPANANYYKHSDQRMRLLTKSCGQWLITLFLCLTIFFLLWGYSRRSNLDPQQRRIFNALAAGLSIALGLNLTSSLGSYAKMMRWRLLASGYRPLSEFELVLGCDSQINVIRLLFSPRHHTKSRGVRWWCIVWLLVNVAATILVAIIGLTYNLDTNTSVDDPTVVGSVSVIDWSQLISLGYYPALISIQAFGADSMQYYGSNTLSKDGAAWDTYEYLGSTSRYWFVDYNPNDVDQTVISNRYIDATASCQAFPVVQGAYGNLTYFTYEDVGGVRKNVTIEPQDSSGGILFMANTESACGLRCTNVDALQTLDRGKRSSGVVETTKSQFFRCTNKMSFVQGIPLDFNPAPYEVSSYVARMLAGGIGWSGNYVSSNSWEYVYYADSSFPYWQEAKYKTNSTNFDVDDMAQIISKFTAAAIAYMDDPISGITPRRTTDGYEPVYAQHLKVNWLRCGLLLAGLPALHFLTLFAVIMWANKAIIKDHSYIANAKLLHPIIDKLHGKGCMMQGEDLIAEVGDPHVVYGYEEVGEKGSTALKTLDVFVAENNVKVGKRFQEGWYV